MSIADALLIVGAASGILSLVITAWRERNKPTVDSANASSVNTAANIALIEPLTKRIDALEFELNEMRDELKKRDEIIERQNVGIGILLTQIGRARLTPDWKPTAYTTTPPAPATGFKR